MLIFRAWATCGFSCIQGTSYGRRAAHCKILEWQVMNKKMHGYSMEHVQKQHLDCLVLIQEWGVARLKCF